jgi:hypothetical protein
VAEVPPEVLDWRLAPIPVRVGVMEMIISGQLHRREMLILRTDARSIMPNVLEKKLTTQACK